MESIEAITAKLLAAYGAQHQLEKLRQRAVPGIVRLLEGARTILPLGMIPITLVWTAVVFFLPVGDPFKLIRLYALGLLAMMLGAGLLLLLQALLSRIKLSDKILGEMALLPGLAYHPNIVLRRNVAARGYATLGEFRQWFDKQREILETRVGDFEVALENLRRGDRFPPPNYESLPPGARAFLED